MRRLYARFAPKKPLPREIRVTFYPFAGFNNTIRLRQGVLHVRFSDLLESASPEVREAVAGILVAKLHKKPVPSAYETVFQTFAQQQSVKTAITDLRRTRGFKYVTGSKGCHHDLTEFFDELNRDYFNNRLERPTLTWSRARTRRILGHYDLAHHTITISRSLDTADTPRFFVAYVMYHEMLHIKHKARRVNGRNLVHTPEFSADEKRFADFDRAEAWLRNWATRKRR